MPRLVAAAAFLAAALLGAPALAADIKVTPPERGGPGMIFVNGDIREGDAETFRRATAMFSQATVVLESNGGNLLNGIDMGREVRRKGFSTMVPNGATCASVCASVWLAGVNRYVGPSSQIGFHAAYVVVGGKAEESADALARHAAYFRSIGLSESTIRYIDMAAPGTMTWMNEAAAKTVGISYTVVGRAGPAATTLPVQGEFGRPTYFHDLKLRAAAFTEVKPTERGCRMLLAAEGTDLDSYVEIDVPRAGAPGGPSLFVFSRNIQDAGQPRMALVDGEPFALERGAEWGALRGDDARRAIAAMSRAGSFKVTAYKIDGTTGIHKFGSKNLADAVARTARDCGGRVAQADLPARR